MNSSPLPPTPDTPEPQEKKKWEEIKRREELALMELREKNELTMRRTGVLARWGTGLAEMFDKGIDALLWRWVSDDVEEARREEERRLKQKERPPSRYRPAPPEDPNAP